MTIVNLIKIVSFLNIPFVFAHCSIAPHGYINCLVFFAFVYHEFLHRGTTYSKAGILPGLLVPLAIGFSFK